MKWLNGSGLEFPFIYVDNGNALTSPSKFNFPDRVHFWSRIKLTADLPIVTHSIFSRDYLVSKVNENAVFSSGALKSGDTCFLEQGEIKHMILAPWKPKGPEVWLGHPPAKIFMPTALCLFYLWHRSGRSFTKTRATPASPQQMLFSWASSPGSPAYLIPWSFQILISLVWGLRLDEMMTVVIPFVS